MMLKRARASDARQFRRTVKKPRFEAAYFKNPTTSCIKVLVVWLLCLLIDSATGCRIELGYQILVFFRHYNETVNLPNRDWRRFFTKVSFFYLALAVISDLICYSLIPVEQLLFISSTIVWLQLAYHGIDRDSYSSLIFFWVLFVGFEFCYRFRQFSLAWMPDYVWLRISLFTGSLLGHPMTETRLEFHRVIGAHALGFPFILLCCRLKAAVENWLYERRRAEVQRENEIYDRILTEALPAVYEGKKRHEMNSRLHHLAIEGDPIDFELDPTGSDLMDDQRLCISSNGTMPSMFDKTGTSASTSPGRNSNRHTDQLPVPRKTSKAKLPQKHQNGTAHLHGGGHEKCGKAGKTRNGGVARAGLDLALDELAPADKPEEDSIPPPSMPNFTRIVNALVSLVGVLFSFVKRSTSVVTDMATNRTEVTAVPNGDLLPSNDEATSTSGNSSQRAEDDSDRESIATSTMDLPPFANGTSVHPHVYKSNNNVSKRKGKHHHQHQQQQQHARKMTEPDGEYELVPNGLTNGLKTRGKAKPEERREDELERLRTDLRGARLIESDLREQIASLSQVEKVCKNEVQQFRLRFDQLDHKHKAHAKQLEQAKTNVANLEKRLAETQVRKEQLERDLATERSLSKLAKMEEERPAVDPVTEGLRKNVNRLEAELRKLRTELKGKEEQSTKLEQRLKDMQTQKSQAQKHATDGTITVNRLELENQSLRKALSEENRIKQELFKALKTAKAELALLNPLASDPPSTNNSTPVNLGAPDFFAPPVAPDLDHLMSVSGTHYMSYPFSNQSSSSVLASIRSSPSNLRDSPPVMPSPIDTSRHLAPAVTTTAADRSV